jgi:hypothetical protein
MLSKIRPKKLYEPNYSLNNVSETKLIWTPVNKMVQQMEKHQNCCPIIKWN